MTNTSHLTRVVACLLAICILFVSGCGITPHDAMTPGSKPLTAEEYVTRYAGNSIRFEITAGKGEYREMYFGKDGTLQVVDLWQETIMEGTWKINSTLNPSLQINFAFLGFEDGKAFRSGPVSIKMFVYVLPDGQASVFQMSPSGHSIRWHPKPTPGFQSRARFNTIKQKVVRAIGS